MKVSDLSPRRIRLLTALILVATFILGAVTGAGLTRWLGPHHPLGPPPFFMGPQYQELHLTQEQQAKAREIGERYRPQIESVVRETFPRVRSIHEQMDKEFRALLTPEQQTKFDEIKARPPFPPPPGGRPMHGPPGPSGFVPDGRMPPPPPPGMGPPPGQFPEPSPS